MFVHASLRGHDMLSCCHSGGFENEKNLHYYLVLQSLDITEGGISTKQGEF